MPHQLVVTMPQERSPLPPSSMGSAPITKPLHDRRGRSSGISFERHSMVILEQLASLIDCDDSSDDDNEDEMIDEPQGGFEGASVEGSRRSSLNVIGRIEDEIIEEGIRAGKLAALIGRRGVSFARRAPDSPSPPSELASFPLARPDLQGDIEAALRDLMVSAGDPVAVGMPTQSDPETDNQHYDENDDNVAIPLSAAVLGTVGESSGGGAAHVQAAQPRLGGALSGELSIERSKEEKRY